MRQSYEIKSLTASRKNSNSSKIYAQKSLTHLKPKTNLVKNINPIKNFKFHNNANLLTCEQDHTFLLFKNKRQPVSEIKNVKFWPMAVTAGGLGAAGLGAASKEKHWRYWQNDIQKTPIRERTQVFNVVERILKNRKISEKNIPEYIWSEEATSSWLDRNKSSLSIEKRYLLENILKKLRSAFLEICKSDNKTELEKALVSQAAVVKCSRSLKNILSKIEGMKNANDPIAANFVHKKLLDELPKGMLSIYLDCLIYLKSRAPFLLEGMIEAFVEVNSDQPISIALKAINEIKYSSELPVSFPPLPKRLPIPKRPLFIRIPSTLPGMSDTDFNRPTFWTKQFKQMGQHESLGQKEPGQKENLGFKLIRSCVETIQKDTMRSEMDGEKEIEFSQVTPQEWVDAVLLAILTRIRNIEDINTKVYLYGWTTGASLIAQAIARMPPKDLIRVSGVILLGLPLNEQNAVSIDNNLINTFRVPVFAAFGEKSKDFNNESLATLTEIISNRAPEFQKDHYNNLENIQSQIALSATVLTQNQADTNVASATGSKQVNYFEQYIDRQKNSSTKLPYFHYMIVPDSDHLLRLAPKARTKKFLLTKQAIDHQIIDKIFEFVVDTLGLSGLEMSSLEGYKPISTALNDTNYLEECENRNSAFNVINLSTGILSRSRIKSDSDKKCDRKNLENANHNTCINLNTVNLLSPDRLNTDETQMINTNKRSLSSNVNVIKLGKPIRLSPSPMTASRPTPVLGSINLSGKTPSINLSGKNIGLLKPINISSHSSNSGSSNPRNQPMASPIPSAGVTLKRKPENPTNSGTPQKKFKSFKI